MQSWLRGHGFTAITTDAQRNYVRATGSIAAIDAAFRVQMENYRSSANVNAGRYQLHANNRAVSIPRSLAHYVIGVTGLDNAAPKLPLMRAPRAAGRTDAGRTAGEPTAPCSHYYGQHHISGLPERFGRTSFPTRICGYSAEQLRGAYGVNMHNNGRGQTVSLVELGLTPDMFLTLQDYAKSDQFVAPSPLRYSELSLGQDTCGDPFNGEEQMDVESAYDMAPGANQLVVGGDSCNNGDYGMQGLFDADIVTIDGTGGSNYPLANISSNSWDLDTGMPAILTKIMHAYLVRAAAQGVGMYFASGDASGLETPGDPFSILVGGTSLAIGQHNQLMYQTGWSSGLSVIKNGHWLLKREDGASSGGPSLIWAQPGYQHGVVPKALAQGPGRPGLVRSEPDIAADADVFTPFALGRLFFPKNKPPKYFTIPNGGTSLSTPLVAGMIADAQQGQPTPFGFTDPALYRLNGTSALRDVMPSTSRTPGQFRGVVCPASVLRPVVVGDVRRPEPPPAWLHRSGHSQGLRQHDRPRHTERSAVHHSPAQDGGLNRREPGTSRPGLPCQPRGLTSDRTTPATAGTVWLRRLPGSSPLRLVPLVCLVAIVGDGSLPSAGVVVSLRLFVSPVKPSSTQVGAELLVAVRAVCASSVVLVPKFASLPPPSPYTPHSVVFQKAARSILLSLLVTLRRLP